MKIIRSQDISISVILVIGLAAQFLISSFNFLLAHAFAEMFSISVALVIFFIAWNAREYFTNSYFMFLGTAYLFIGLVDLLHTLAYKGMGVFPGFDANPATQLWIVGRYMESIALLSAVAFLRRSISAYLTFFLWALIAAVGILVVFSGMFPDCYIEGVGLTVFKRTSEFVIIGLLAVTVFLLRKNKRHFSPPVIRNLYASIILTMCAEFAFIMYVGVYDLSNLLGHYFKIVSFFLIYRGVIVTGFKDPYAILMRELKQRNDELEQSRDHIAYSQRITSTMLDNIPEEVVLLEKSTCRIIDANETFLRTHDITKEEALGKRCHEIIHHLTVPCFEKSLDCPLRAAEPAMPGPLVPTHFDRTGDARYMDVSVWPVVHKDQTGEEVIYIARDITRRRRAEQMREDIERVVRHDLKSPLNGIIGGARLLTGDDNLTSEQLEMLNAIGTAGASVLTSVEKSLEIYNMEEGRYQPVREQFDLIEVLRQLDRRLMITRRKKVVHVEFRIDGCNLKEIGPLIMNAERQGIETLLFNLTENAVDASPDGGTVTIMVETSPESVHFDIHNMGVIPVEIRDRFFERYVTSGKKKGTGLGTYSIYLITRAHGGTVRYTTDEKTGTHLLVDIPVSFISLAGLGADPFPVPREE